VGPYNSKYVIDPSDGAPLAEFAAELLSTEKNYSYIRMRLVICCFEIAAIVEWYTEIARDMDGKYNMRLHTM